MTLDEFKTLIRLNQIPAFLVSTEISEMAQRLVADEMADRDSWGDCHIPADAIRHSTAMAIALPSAKLGNESLSVFFLDEPEGEPSGSPLTIVLAVEGGKIVQFGQFAAGGNSFIDERWLKASADVNHQMAHAIAVCAFCLSLINQPTITIKRPLLPRQQRRADARAGNTASESWHLVEWDLSRQSVERAAKGKDFRRVPLHWRRGHFRKAEAHYASAVYRPAAVDGVNWFQWIAGQWVGHPAFGIKRSIHAPKMTEGIRSKAGVAA